MKRFLSSLFVLLLIGVAILLLTDSNPVSKETVHGYQFRSVVEEDWGIPQSAYTSVLYCRPLGSDNYLEVACRAWGRWRTPYPFKPSLCRTDDYSFVYGTIESTDLCYISEVHIFNSDNTHLGYYDPWKRSISKAVATSPHVWRSLKTFLSDKSGYPPHQLIDSLDCDSRKHIREGENIYYLSVSDWLDR